MVSGKSMDYKLTMSLDGFYSGNELVMTMNPPNMPELSIEKFRIIPFDKNNSDLGFHRFLWPILYQVEASYRTTDSQLTATHINQAKSDGEALLSALRLYKGGYVASTIGTVKEYTGNSSYLFALSPTFIKSDWDFKVGPEEYVGFQNGVSQLLKAFSRDRNNPALLFFSRGVEDIVRSDYGIALSDFIICMESLLVRGTAESTQKLSEAVSWVTEPDAQERENRYKKVKKLYGQRSEILHGTKKSAPQASALSAEFMARACLRMFAGYLSIGSNIENLRNDIQDLKLGRIKGLSDDANNFVSTLPQETDFKESGS